MCSVGLEHPRSVGNRDDSFGSGAHDAVDFVEYRGFTPDVFENLKTQK